MEYFALCCSAAPATRCYISPFLLALNQKEATYLTRKRLNLKGSHHASKRNLSQAHLLFLETGDKIIFAPFLPRFWTETECTFHLRQLIMRARSRLRCSNVCCANSFIYHSKFVLFRIEPVDFCLFSIAWPP